MEEISLDIGIKDGTHALELFLENKFELAKTEMKPFIEKSYYHALAYATIYFLQASITMEPSHLDEAATYIKSAVAMCHNSRKRISFTANIAPSKSTKIAQFKSFTDEEAHAELCYAECLLEKAMITFVKDENLVALVKGALKINECYKTYKELWKILKYKDNWQNQKRQQSFESGVRLGVGAFNVMISLLPTRVLKLLEFVGFSANKDFGLEQIRISCTVQDGLRSILSSVFLLIYNCYVRIIMGIGQCNDNIQEANEHLEPLITKFSNSSLFLFFCGRIAFISGQFDSAIEKYQIAADCQTEWANLAHLCYWEMIWCFAVQGEWMLAMKYAEKLVNESRWSKATYLYMKMAFLVQFSRESELTDAEMNKHIQKLIDILPSLLQRIAGKSLPMEKFALKKAKRYLEQKEYLALPALELLYIWNCFKIVSWRSDYLEHFVAVVDGELEKIEQHKATHKYYHDDLLLAMLIKAVCLRYLNKFEECKQLLFEIVSQAKHLKMDTYIAPFTEAEISLVFLAAQDFKNARKHLEKARMYKHYSLESRLHFRMHAISMEIKRQAPNEEFSTSIPILSSLLISSGGGGNTGETCSNSSSNKRLGRDQNSSDRSSDIQMGEEIFLDCETNSNIVQPEIDDDDNNNNKNSEKDGILVTNDVSDADSPRIELDSVDEKFIAKG